MLITREVAEAMTEFDMAVRRVRVAMDRYVDDPTTNNGMAADDEIEVMQKVARYAVRLAREAVEEAEANGEPAPRIKALRRQYERVLRETN